MEHKTKILSLCAVIAVLTIAGTWADKKEAEATSQKLMQFKVQPELIKTRELRSPAEYQSVSTGKFQSASTYWVAAEADGWLLLNGPNGTATCPQVLSMFGAANASQYSMDLATIRMLVAGFHERELELSVYVPRFKSAPAGISSCTGMAYDQKTGQLRIGSKYVAYLAPSQPQLANLPR